MDDKKIQLLKPKTIEGTINPIVIGHISYTLPQDILEQKTIDILNHLQGMRGDQVKLILENVERQITFLTLEFPYHPQKD